MQHFVTLYLVNRLLCQYFHLPPICLFEISAAQFLSIRVANVSKLQEDWMSEELTSQMEEFHWQPFYSFLFLSTWH